MKISKKLTNVFTVTGISVFTIILALSISYTTMLQTIELKLLDFRFGLRGAESLEDPPIVIIGIDDQSDESTPHRWPWPRSYFAHVIENLEEAGAAVIGVDVIFDQPDKYGQESDDELAAVLKKYDNIVLTGKLLRMIHTYKSYSTIIPPYEKFIENTNTPWGLVAIEADIDGFYRRYSLGQVYNDSLMPSFAAEVIRLYQRNNQNKYLKADESFFYLGDRKIPKYDVHSMLINFVGPERSFPYYPFDNVLDDEDFDLLEDYDLDTFDDPGDIELEIPPGLKYSGKLTDKIVLIGSTMHELHDNFPTPFLEYLTSEGVKVKAETPGVEIHANAILTILRNNYLNEPPEYFIFIIIIFLAILIFVLTRFLPTGWGSVAVLGLTALYVAIAIAVFIKFNLILTITGPVLVALFTFLGHTVYQYLLTQQEKKMLRGAFGHYVPEKVIQEILNDPDKLTLGGEERIVTVLFSDVAGFTSISEVLAPRDLVSLLNEYLTVMTDIVLKHNGIIDKYEGDAIMAEFGVPVSFPDHAAAGCRTALEMQKELRNLRVRWEREGKPALTARIGVNTGEVIVGNMGSRDVFDYTVMGDAVNLGARLEGTNKFYRTKIMISEFTNKLVKDDFYTRPLDLIRVKGKQKPIEVFELLADRKTNFTDNFLELLKVYYNGVEAYRQQNWNEAIDIFEYCLKLLPEDYPSKMYHKRCVKYKFNSPGPDWDGVTTMTEK